MWGAGVTYERSRDSHTKESTVRDVYDLVYAAHRPELFLKDAMCRRTVGPGEPVGIRGDSTWNVPEPEIALVIGERGRILAYTIANDMSSREIEGANPLYLTQAKVYAGACAIGPALHRDVRQGLWAEASARGVSLTAANPERYLPSRRAIHQELTAGKLGRLGLVRIHRWLSAPNPRFQTDDHAVFGPLDLALWLFGSRPEVVFATGATSKPGTIFKFTWALPTAGSRSSALPNVSPPAAAITH